MKFGLYIQLQWQSTTRVVPSLQVRCRTYVLVLCQISVAGPVRHIVGALCRAMLVMHVCNISCPGDCCAVRMCMVMHACMLPRTPRGCARPAGGKVLHAHSAPLTFCGNCPSTSRALASTSCCAASASPLMLPGALLHASMHVKVRCMNRLLHVPSPAAANRQAWQGCQAYVRIRHTV